MDEMKELVDSMASAIDAVAAQMDLEPGVGDNAKFQLGMFLMYLSASDGEISWDEADVISRLCDLDVTPTKLADFIRNSNIYSTEFEQTVPLALEVMLLADNMGMTEDSLSKLVIDTFKTVGEALIKSDNEVDENEMEDFNIYINMMEKYREEKYVGCKSATTGFIKNKGESVSAPTKGGVAAPRKG